MSCVRKTVGELGEVRRRRLRDKEQPTVPPRPSYHALWKSRGAVNELHCTWWTPACPQTTPLPPSALKEKPSFFSHPPFLLANPSLSETHARAVLPTALSVHILTSPHCTRFCLTFPQPPTSVSVSLHHPGWQSLTSLSPPILTL